MGSRMSHMPSIRNICFGSIEECVLRFDLRQREEVGLTPARFFFYITIYYGETMPWEEPKCKCGEEANPPHTCPYAEEIGEDSETTCVCCDECTTECVREI